MIRYTTMLGRVLELEDKPAKLATFYAKILACETGAAAEDLAYGPKNPLAVAHNVAGLPIWTAEQLRDPRWAYLQDAVARCRLAAGELDLESVMRAASWEVAEAARSLGVTPASVRQHIDTGALPAVQVAGRWLLDRRAVEAFSGVGGRGGPRPASVPALYIRAGVRGEAGVGAIVVNSDGVELEGDLRHDLDGVEERVVEAWDEALITAGTAGKLRAWRVRPAHGRAVLRLGVAGLEVVGRIEIVDKTNNRGEAAEMLAGFKADLRRRKEATHG